MLRSSREGRKQAARFHAYPPSANLSRLPTSFHNTNRSNSNSSKSHRKLVSSTAFGDAVKASEDVSQQQQPSLSFSSSLEKQLDLPSSSGSEFIPSETLSLPPKAATATTSVANSDAETEMSFQISSHSEVPVLENNTDQSAGPSCSSRERRQSSISEISERFSNEPIVHAPQRTSLAAYQQQQQQQQQQQSRQRRPFEMKEKTPSAETAEGQSRSHSSPLSSPPTSHPDELDEEQYQLQNACFDSYDASLDSDGLHDSLLDEVLRDDDSSTLEVNAETEDLKKRKRYQRFKPREVEGLPLSTERGKRRVVKSLKLVEAEESLSSSPASKRRLQGLASLNASQSTSRRSTISSTERNPGGSKRLLDEHTQDRGVAVKNTSIGIREMHDEAALPKADDASGEIIATKKLGRPIGMTKEKILERTVRKSEEQSKLGESVKEKEERTTSTDSLLRRRSARVSESTLAPLTPENVATVRDVIAVTKAEDRGGQDRHTRRIPLSIDVPLSNSGRALQKDDHSAQGSSKTASTSQLAVAEKSAKTPKATWKRKSFLTSGLYSTDFKNDQETPKKPRAERQQQHAAIQEELSRGTARTRKASAFPLPTDYGRYLLEARADFRLPFNISQEIEEIREKLELKKKPPPYKYISQNRYVSRSKLPGEIMICQCPSDGDCGDSCVNRQTEYLCHPKHCPCGDRCTNIYFGKRKAVKTEVQWYGARGFGLKTLEPIAKGGFIDEYRGEVVDFNEAVRRIRDFYKDTGNYYFLMYDAPAGEMLDGGLKGNITRFANHSCDPNCKVQKWLVCGTDEQRSGEFQVALFAERDIKAGEELTYDYGWSAFAAKAVSGDTSSSSTPEVCHCGAANCSGFLGVKKSAASSAANAIQLKGAKKAKQKDKKRKLQDRHRQLLELGKHRAKAQANAAAAVAAAAATAATALTSDCANDSEERNTKTIARHSEARNHSLSIFAQPPSTPTLSGTPGIGARRSTSGLLDTFMNQLGSPLSSLSSLSSISDEDAKQAEQTLLSSTADSLLTRAAIKERERPRISLRMKSQSSADSPSSSNDADYTNRARGGFPNSRRGVLHPNTNSEMALHSSRGRTIEEHKAEHAVQPESFLKRKSENGNLGNSTTAPKRLKVKDRVIRVLMPIEAWKEAPLVLEGKRERRLSQKAAAEQEVNEAAAAAAAAAASSPKSKGRRRKSGDKNDDDDNNDDARSRFAKKRRRNPSSSAFMTNQERDDDYGTFDDSYDLDDDDEGSDFMTTTTTMMKRRSKGTAPTKDSPRGLRAIKGDPLSNHKNLNGVDQVPTRSR